MKYKGLKSASAATRRETCPATDVAIILEGNTIRTRTLCHDGWLQTDADAVIYTNKPMTMDEIAAQLDRRKMELEALAYMMGEA